MKEYNANNSFSLNNVISKNDNVITNNDNDSKFVKSERDKNYDENIDNNGFNNFEERKNISIDKIGFYEIVLKQLLDDNLIDSFNVLKKELNLQENKNVENDYLFNLYAKNIYKSSEPNNEKNIESLVNIESMIKRVKSFNDSVLNYDIKSENIKRLYRYEINDHIELIHRNKCICCDTNYSHNILCSGGLDNVVKIAKIYDKKKKVYNIEKHNGKVNCVKFHPFKNILFSASDDCTVQIFDLNKLLKKKKLANKVNINENINETYKNILIQDKNPFICLYVHPCGDFLYTSNKNENILKMYDLETLTCYISLDKNSFHTSSINSISGTSDGSIYSSVSDDGHIKFWDGHNSKLIHTQCNAHNGYSVQSVKFNKSNFYILTSGLDGQTKIWDIRNFKSLFTFGNGLSCSFNKSIFMNNESFIANIIHTSNNLSSSHFYIYNSYFGNMEYNIQNIHNDQISDIVNAKDSLNVHTASYDYVCKTIKIEQKYLDDYN
ncbi:cleavage stimulation factor subunit 1, putative [Plasmodium gallinaceum]|uniref:Cleavage stimulation factor 50 kDa subunit n=1 Tax=Plasmodium gallinaceum TaxID=5849 RepID=A0A1J1GR80_PLAGA|nr:cleavage stimulation factor subunit 1, putative [Plasmodium gallinaceum]CRG93783.1 cleavage stimulation factor subunit 1, putative [Plasmodium gallinaceum]